MTTLEQTDTVLAPGLEEPVICQAEDENGPCDAEAEWVSRTECCNTPWTLCDMHRESYFVQSQIFGAEWSCGSCGAYPLPGLTWEKL